MLNDITNQIAEIGANFTSFNANAKDDGHTKMNFMFVLSDLSMTEKLTVEIKKIDGVLSVYRAASSKKG